MPEQHPDGLRRTEHPNALKVISHSPDEVLMRWGDGESKLVEMDVLRSIVAEHGGRNG